jgi:large subunit ribosomal protein L28e
MASAALIWECVKTNNSFMRKSPGAGNKTMSAEPGNLLGLHSFKFSGIANDKVLGLAPTKTGKKEKITLTTKAKKPAKLFEPKGLILEKGIKKDAKKGPEQLKKVMDAGFYRKDLLDLAMAKYAKIKTSFKAKKLTVKSRRAKE